MDIRTQRRFYILLMAVYLGTIGWLCFGAFDNVDMSPSLLNIPTDKIVHAMMFLPFPILCGRIFKRAATKPWISLVLVIGYFLTGCILAAGTELGQGLTDYRTADVQDFMADGTGLAIGSVLALCLDLGAAFKKA